MPSSTLDDLAEAYSQVSLINKRLLDECEVVGQTFHQKGIECILLKGADLLSRLYGMRGPRPLSDVDLLVHEQDLPVIHRLLMETGFTQQIDGNPAYISSQSTLTLDLISELWYLDEQGLAELWARARSRPLGRLMVKQLASDDLFGRLHRRPPGILRAIIFHRSQIADREGSHPLADRGRGSG